MSTVATELPLPTPGTRGTAGRVMRRAYDIVTTFLAVLVVVVGAVAAVVAVATHFAPEGQYTIAGHPVLSVLSGSMAPAINTGDMIVDDPVSAAQARQLQVGQIITFRESSGSLAVTHRIVGVVTATDGGVAYRTKGDANDAPDTSLRPAASVVGVYHARIPAGGYVLNALHRPLVLGLLLASPLLWFLSGLLRNWAREMELEEANQSASNGGVREGEPK